ncbi:MAG: glycosyltransferase, partial [Actinomycetota bacterium]|nr:glycosyltransferase [Actinomycetota bacterium]
ESFSMVILESWVAGTPVLVNAKCGATVEHASRGQGGLWFDDYPSFEVALDRLVRDTALRDALALNGLNYTVATFSWEAVIDRYVGFCRSMLAHRK